MRYDTRCYFSVRSKADMRQRNLPHGCHMANKIQLGRLTDLRKDSMNFLRFFTLVVVLSSSWYLSIVLFSWS